MKIAGEYTGVECLSASCLRRRADVYFSETCKLVAKLDHFRKMLSPEELLRADQLYFEEMRQTYVICHGLLRLLLGIRLGLNSSEIIILRDARSKPYLKDHPLYFNLSHTKNAFAIAICHDFQIGIDLEKINPCLDYSSISGTVLNSREKVYVEENPEELYDRFFMLWTRKEAYLKGVGSGIAYDMWKIDSLQERESLKRRFPEGKIKGLLNESFFVYSERILNYFLSVASPGRIIIQTHCIDEAFCKKPDSLIFG